MNTDINELHEKFSEYGKSAKEWQRKCILLLPETVRLRVWEEKGFSCIYEYAGKLAGMSKGQVIDALYILKKIEDKPALMRVVEEKGINAVRPVVSIATMEDEKFWAGKAREMGNNTLRVFVRDVTREALVMNESQQVRDIPKNENKIKIIAMQLPSKLAQRLEKLKGAGSWAEIVEELVEAKEKENAIRKIKLEEEKPEAMRTDSKHVPRGIRSYIRRRSEGKCEFPNCGKKTEHLHHVNRFSSDKVHDPDMIVALCKAHHDLAHRGLIEGEDGSTEDWKITKERDYTNLNWYVDRQYELYRR